MQDDNHRSASKYAVGILPDHMGEPNTLVCALTNEREGKAMNRRHQNPIAIACISIAAITAASTAQAENASDLDILQAYASDFEQDSFLQDAMTFGVKVGDDFYTIDIVPAIEGVPAKTAVRTGQPEAPTFFFAIDKSETLAKLHSGDVHALTLAGKAVGADFAPLDISAMEGFEPPEWFSEKITRLLFHFWTRGTPEVVPFGRQDTRLIHGVHLGAFYYQPGFRSAWFDMRPGEHANEGEEDSSNPFPSMFIVVEGVVTARIGGAEVTLRAGEMAFVPAGEPHEFINESSKNAKGFLMMFGEGA